MTKYDNTGRLHRDVQDMLEAAMEVGERPLIVVNGNGPTGVILTKDRLLIFSRERTSAWQVADIETATFDGTTFAVAGPTLIGGATSVSVYPDKVAKACATAAKATLDKWLDDRILRTQQADYMAEHGAAPETRPLVAHQGIR